nr:HD domain-containing protein [Ardenticatena sp.]
MLNPFVPPDVLWERLSSTFPSSTAPTLVHRAYDVASRAHAHQRRKEGTPYLVHPLRVALILAEERAITDADLVATALVHDVVEDSSLTIADVATLVSPAVADLVRWLTKPPAQDGDKAARDAAYFTALYDAPLGARLVKLADRLDNVRYLHTACDPRWARAYRAETRRWLVPLADRTDAWFAAHLRSYVGDETLQPWETRATRTLYAAEPWLTLVADTIERVPDDPAPIAPFYRIQSPEYVLVVPRFADGRYLTLRQYRHGMGCIFHQFPAGVVDAGETPRVAAERELLEETGYTAARWVALGAYVVDVNRGSGRAHLYLADEITPHDGMRPVSDDLEAHEMVVLSREEIAAQIRLGLFHSLACVAAFALAERHQ